MHRGKGSRCPPGQRGDKSFHLRAVIRRRFRPDRRRSQHHLLPKRHVLLGLRLDDLRTKEEQCNVVVPMFDVLGRITSVLGVSRICCEATSTGPFLAGRFRAPAGFAEVGKGTAYLLRQLWVVGIVSP